jgi:Xaa-Pro aminopeptidase
MSNNVNFERMQRERVGRLQHEMGVQGLGALYLAEEPNVRYVTNVKAPGTSVFLPREGEPILYVRPRDQGYVQRQFANTRPASRNSNATGPELAEKLARWSKEMKATMKEFGVEEERLGVDLLDIGSFRGLVEEAINAVDGRYALTVAKRVKTQDEVSCFRMIGGWYQDVMQRFQESICPGLRETDLAAIVHHAAIRNGVEDIFQLNVCAGENMNPWRRWPTQREVKPEEFVGIDLHVVGPGGCWADVSRTYYCGEKPIQEQRDLYQLAHDYLQGVIALLRPGERIDQIVKKAPPVPEKYRPLLDNYSIAHSDAMKPHEFPRIERKKPSQDLLEPNMIFSVETYFSEVGGSQTVKLEELVAVTENGVEVLSTAPFDERFVS